MIGSNLLPAWSPSNIMDLVFKEFPTFSDLATIISFLACAFAVLMEVSRPILIAICKSPLLLPLMKKVCDREWGRPDVKEMNAMLFGIKTKEQYLQRGVIEGFGGFLVVFQHIFGGFLCIPSAYYSMTGKLMVGDLNTSTSLACLGIMVEAGMDLNDFVVLPLKRIFSKNGKELYPNAIFVFLVLHHSLSLVVGTLMILHYRDSPLLHRQCLNLQGAAGLGLLFQQVGRFLDITDPTQLALFQAQNLFMLLVFVWTRAIDWNYSFIKLFYLWYQDKNWTMMGAGAFIYILFSLFNYFVCIIPMYKKFVKFMKKSAQHKSLEKDPNADAKSRRASMMDLQSAATELLDTTNDEQAALSLFEWEDRVVERRQTLNPALMTAGRRPSSLAVASTGRRYTMGVIPSTWKMQLDDLKED